MATHNRIEVGRVIFNESAWLVQPLKNHVDNVTHLARLWDNQRAFSDCPEKQQETRAQVIAAAEIHDMAKPVKFRLVYQQNKFSKKWEWSYSFAGHRFEAFHDNTYVQALAQLHHEYSVSGITKNIAQLRQHSDPSINRVADNLPIDLYALEMCDQIEATFSSSILGEENPEARVFMDFQFDPDPVAPLTYQIDPFVFIEEPVHLPIEYVEIQPPLDKLAAVEQASNDDNRRSLLYDLQQWLLAQLHNDNPPLIQTKEVTLCPWT